MPTELSTRKPSPVPRTDEPNSSEPPTGLGWTRRRRFVTVVLVVLNLLAGAGVLYLTGRQAEPDVQPAISKDGDYTPGSIPDRDAAAALNAAVDHVPRILSYDYRKLDEHVGTVSSAMTEKFAATFSDTFSTVVKPAATKNHAVTKALVRGAGVTDTRGGQATIMLFIDQVLITGKGSDQAKPSIGRERVTVSLRQIDGHWLIDEIKPF